MRFISTCVVSTAATICLAASADAFEILLTVNGSGYGRPVVRRFDSLTGADRGGFNVLPGEELDGIGVAPDGSVYVAQNGLGSGIVTRHNAATGALLNTSAIQSDFTVPFGLGFAADGRLIVADNQFPQGVGQSGIFGFSADLATGSQFAAVPGAVTFSESVYDVATLSTGNILASVTAPTTSNGRVLRFNGATGQSLGTFVAAGTAEVSTAGAIDVGPDGNVYLVDANRVLRFAGSGAFIDTFIAAGSGGLGSPTDLHFGPDGNLYVVNAGTRSVLRYAPTGAFLGTAVQLPLTGDYRPAFMIFIVPEPTSAALVASSLLAVRRTRRAGPRSARSGEAPQQ